MVDNDLLDRAVEMEKQRNQYRSLCCRAAELLRQSDRLQLGSVTWEQDRDQWLAEAGFEEREGK